MGKSNVFLWLGNRIDDFEQIKCLETVPFVGLEPICAIRFRNEKLLSANGQFYPPSTN